MQFFRLKLYKLILFIFLSFVLGNCAYLEAQVSSTERQFKIAIFREESFPSIECPSSYMPEWLHSNLSEKFPVTYLDSVELSDRKCLNLDNFDLLIMPYGEAFPYNAFQNIKQYLFEGGGLLNIAGRPFWAPMDKIDGGWKRHDIADPYKEFLSPLGIKYYQSSENDNIGLNVTTSLGFNPVQPTHGNVFPYRIPARDFYSLDKFPIVFVKSWRNPYIKESKNIPGKWCLIGTPGEDNPLNSQDSSAKKVLTEIAEHLSYPVIIYGLEPDFAGYYQGEKVRISSKILNNGRSKEAAIIEFKILDQEDKVVYKKDKFIKLGPGQKITLRETWQPEAFHGTFYKISASLKSNDIVFDKEENGFVVIDKGVQKNWPSIKIEEKGFIINGERSLILGVNYYESKLGELMWVRPNILKIREDFKAMRGLGINFVRIHYHHSKWFRDYFSQVVKEKIDPYFQVTDATALPSKRSLRILDAIIQLSQEQGLIFCMDIFSLVPQEMGNPIGWLGLKERIVDENKITTQKKFIDLLAMRYKDVPGITWDLWNEPSLDKNDIGLLKNWAREIKEVFRERGDNHLITIGDDLSLHLLDILDYACVHTYEPAEFTFIKDLDKPFIFQEVWNEAGCSLNDEIKQKEELIKDFKAFLETQAAGFVPWQWTRQARLWDNASDSEKWDNDLGLYVREDGSLKPTAEIYYSLINSAKKYKVMEPK